MKRFVVLTATVLVAAVGLASHPATAKPPGPNGRILFVQDTKDCDDCISKSIEPDGSGTIQLPGSSGRYSPDGTRIMAGTETADHRFGTMVMNADGSDVTVFPIPGSTLFLPCAQWSPDGEKLLCEGWDETNPDRLPGLFAIDSSDGSHVTRLTTNTLGGHDIPGDFSPDGSRIVFLREDPGHGRFALALFVANADGSAPHRISGWKDDNACCQASWSPDGTRILFAFGAGCGRSGPTARRSRRSRSTAVRSSISSPTRPGRPTARTSRS